VRREVLVVVGVLVPEVWVPLPLGAWLAEVAEEMVDWMSALTEEATSEEVYAARRPSRSVPVAETSGGSWAGRSLRGFERYQIALIVAWLSRGEFHLRFLVFLCLLYRWC